MCATRGRHGAVVAWGHLSGRLKDRSSRAYRGLPGGAQDGAVGRSNAERAASEAASLSFT